MAGAIILGAGGHAKVVADILQLQNIEVQGFLDDNPSIVGLLVGGCPVLGTIIQYASFDCLGFISGVGSNAHRMNIVKRLEHEANPAWLNAIHPSAVVARSVRVGHGIVFAAQAVANPDTLIGNHVIINTGATIDHDCVVSDYVHIAPGVHLAGGIKVGIGVLVGIGARVIPNCSIGDWSTIAAGATVVHDIPPNVTAKGTPARW